MPETFGTLLPLNSVWSERFPDDYFESGKLFIDWLSKTGQNVWQMLPLQANTWHANEPYFFSPYYTYGVGLNPLFLPLRQRHGPFPPASKEFLRDNAFWLTDYSEFMAISEKMGTDLWLDWPDELKNAEARTVKDLLSTLSERVKFFVDQQAFVHAKFKNLHEYGESKGVKIWGDLPFFVPPNSPLVWGNIDCFEIDADGTMRFVSGVAASKYFIRQIWGHPLYAWRDEESLIKVMDFWKMRLDYISRVFNFVRFDSAIRFYTYGKIHVSSQDMDQTVFGPADRIFEALVNYARKINLGVFAEDITAFDMSSLHAAMKKLDVPGMSVFTMGMSKEEKDFDKDHFNPGLFKENHIFYTSTHDVRPLLLYLEELPEWQREVISKKLHIINFVDSRKMAEEVRSKMKNECKNLIVPMQDWLLSKHRINVPGTLQAENWNYRMEVSVENLPNISS